ncbi:HSP20-like chaperone [Aaosphaeria arxii CBS 175.79]|uniref:HSP20-like chaperone n=1 Tax=Aaosphaeria arxii CBS 175.79 TaxID=1450172 RepID=A0A6A5XSY7_9PLEO|nr:HSP20-like chaperone [Aaosphaeria arxii CBS 175.79]KAF2016019.1 HSP20-like chaperone [Aaosphaeria arxii CBS 175.79]
MSLFPRFTQEFSPLFRLMDEYERHAFRNADQSIRSFSPKFDVKELKDSYELHGEFPGIEQKDINIEWTDANTLTISGRHETVREEGTRPQTENLLEGSDKQTEHYHKPTVEEEGAETTKTASDTETRVAKKPEQEVAKTDANEPKYWVSERSVGEFHRSFNFPARIDQDAVKASLKNGILSIVVPKAQAPKPRKISIE